MTLTKAELADLLFDKVGLNKREAKDMVESFFEEIRVTLEVMLCRNKYLVCLRNIS
jgi:integration host factor subunit alpha